MNGRVSKLSIAASIVTAPLKIAATAFDTGKSTFCEAASSTKTGAVTIDEAIESLLTRPFKAEG